MDIFWVCPKAMSSGIIPVVPKCFSHPRGYRVTSRSCPQPHSIYSQDQNWAKQFIKKTPDILPLGPRANVPAIIGFHNSYVDGVAVRKARGCAPTRAGRVDGVAAVGGMMMDHAQLTKTSPPNWWERFFSKVTARAEVRLYLLDYYFILR